MADPDFTEITVRNPDTGETRQITKYAHPYFPGWERVDSIGRTVSTTDKEK